MTPLQGAIVAELPTTPTTLPPPGTARLTSPTEGAAPEHWPGWTSPVCQLMVRVASPGWGHHPSRATRSGTSQALPVGGVLSRLVVSEWPLESRSWAWREPLSWQALVE